MSMNCLAYELYWNILSRNMNPIATQQAALDNALVPSEKRLKIKRCNARIAFSKPQREETYQVTLEALKLSPCYPSFMITAEICPRILNQDFIAPPSEEDLVTFIQELGYLAYNVDYVALLWEDFMYQADNREISSTRKEHMPYPRFTKVIINHFISKDKTTSMKNRINLYTIRDNSLVGTLKFVSKTQDYQQYGALIPNDMINQDIKYSSAYKTYYDFATRKVPPRKAKKYKKVVSPPRKLSLVKEAEPVKKGKRVKRPAKKSTTAPTASVVLIDTPGVSVSKKKAPAKGDKDKSMELLSDAALLKVAQVPDESEDKITSTDEGTGTKLGVPDVPTYVSESENESCGDSEDDNDDEGDNDNDDDDVSKGDDDKADIDDDGNSDASDNERTDSDNDDENPSFTLKDYDEEEHDEEYESDDDYEHMFEEEDDDDLYKDVDVRSLGAESEKERKGDEEMTDADHNVSQEQPYKQVVEDAHVTLTASQKTDDSKQSSYVSLDFANQFLILEKVPPIDHKVASLMNIKTSHKSTYEAAKSLTEFELKKILLDKMERSESYKSAHEHKELCEGLVKSYNLDKDLFSSYGKAYSLKRDCEGKDKDEDLSAGSDQGLKKRKKIKDDEPPRSSKSKYS
ncbi:hypothetical protein Tco_0139265 [Tanacetum coccineum]